MLYQRGYLGTASQAARFVASRPAEAELERDAMDEEGRQLRTMLGPTFSLCMLTNSRMILSFSARFKLLRRISCNSAFWIK